MIENIGESRVIIDIVVYCYWLYWLNLFANININIKESAFCVFSKKINKFIKENKVIWKL